MPKVSVIIPCYNHGRYLDDAVQSVLAQTCDDFEIIVVNDGSTDEFTSALLSGYNRQKTHVIHTPNQGLAEARNTGIRASAGEYILPLDADDRIGTEYLAEAIEVFDTNPDVGIVYCEAEYFGEKTGRWELPPHSLDEMLRENHIFCSALFRRKDYDATRGYDPKMTHGWEDWDFWLSLLELGKKVHRIPKVLFYYRVRADSMVRVLDDEKYAILRQRVYRNHLTLYAQHFPDPINLQRANRALRRELEQVYTSRDYRIGNGIMNVLRRVRKRLRG